MARKKAPTLALVMIVKDEEEVLGRCLDSVIGVVDEMVIVDTGSTDRTKEIALSYRDKRGSDGLSPLRLTIVDFKWCDDFSAARNAGLEIVAADWVIALDADEELVSGGSELKYLLRDRYRWAYYTKLTVASPSDENQISDTFFAIRLFRNLENLRYVYPVHEQIEVEGEGRTFFAREVNIHHFGIAVDSPEQHHERGERNRRLLARAIELYPESPYFYFKLGCENLPIKEFSAALALFEKSLARLSPNSTFAPELHRNIAWCHLAIGQPAEARECIVKGRELFPAYTDLVFFEGKIAMQENEYRRAIQLFRQCLAMGDSPDFMSGWPGAGSWRAQQNLIEAIKRSNAMQGVSG